MLLPANNPCVIPPPVAVVTTPASGTCADAGSVPVASGTGSTTIVIQNATPAGGQPLTLTPGSPTNAEFTIFPTTQQTVAPGASQTFTITFDPTATGLRTGNVTFTTNDPNRPTITVCLTGTGT